MDLSTREDPPGRRRYAECVTPPYSAWDILLRAGYASIGS